VNTVALTDNGFVFGILDRHELLEAATDARGDISTLLPADSTFQMRWAA
jgi:hypothetical protein